MSHPIAEIFSQGDEVVNGEIADTNAAWLASELAGLGFEITRHSTVGDRLPALVELLREIAGRADLCLCTGGLGPTSDDHTAEAVSQAFDLPLALDVAALAQMEDWFRRSGRDMPAVNRKQALLPRGSDRLDNRWGTAPGFSLQAGRCRFYFLPGVPREMKALFGAYLQPALPALFNLPLRRRIVLHTVGLGESALQEKLDAITLPRDLQLGFRAGGAETQVKLNFPPATAEPVIEATLAAAQTAIGPAVYAVVRDGQGPASLPAVIGTRLTPQGARVSIVETASAGLLAARCGDADWLAGLALVSDPASIPPSLGVTVAGEPSDVARQLAERLRVRDGVAYALVQWGDFPRAALRDEAAGFDLFVAVEGPAGCQVERRRLSGTAERKRDSAAAFSLDLLRRYLSAAAGAL